LADHQPRSALIVDVDPIFVSELAPIVTACGFRVLALSEFAAARHELFVCRPDVLIANLRLGAFNGIHLAYLAKINKPDTRVMIYGHDDRILAREVQSAGAFYERADFVRDALTAFLHASLPAGDRRTATVTDRRLVFRGGRRTTDLQSRHHRAAT
jgi:DNA-binding NarL/FixJ family response regulator